MHSSAAGAAQAGSPPRGQQGAPPPAQQQPAQASPPASQRGRCACYATSQLAPRIRAYSAAMHLADGVVDAPTTASQLPALRIRGVSAEVVP
jgi:hypothetical protein